MPVRIVMIGSREIAIEQSPILTNVRSSDRFVACTSRPGLLVLRPDWSKRLVGGGALAGGSLLFLVGLLVLRENPVGLVLAIPGGLVMLFGLWLVGPVYRFRRDVREWSTSQFLLTRKRPLAAILAVQATEGGWYSHRRTRGYNEAYRSRFFLYQLNLILDDPAEPRRRLFSYRDAAHVAQTGRTLAEFLAVPLVVSDGVAAKGV